MRKLALFVLGCVLLAGLSTAGFANDVKGPVESIDSSKNEIVVKDAATGASQAIIVHPNVISTLQKGSVVKVSLKPGSNVAQTVEVGY